MNRRGVAAIAVVVVIGLVAGWGWWHHRAASPPITSPAHLAVKWQGRHPGRMTFAAALHWCPVTRVGVLEAISGDSGMVVAVFERNSLTSGAFALLPPTADSAVRPRATVALRWMRIDKDSVLEQFVTGSGALHLQLSGSLASGTVSARLYAAAPAAHDSIAVQGVFRDVPVLTTATGCT